MANKVRRRAGAPHDSISTLLALLEFPAQAVLAVDAGGRLVLANNKACELFGYPPDELIGQPVEVLIADVPPELHHELVTDFFANPRSRPMGIGLEFQGRRKDGSRFPVEVSLNHLETPEGSMGVAFVIDITKRKRTEEALRQSEERLRMALENSGMGLIDHDLRTGKRVWSDTAKSYFGLAPEAEVDEAAFQRGIHPEDWDRVMQARKEAARAEGREPYATEHRTVGTKDGGERWISTRGRVLFDPLGQPERFVGVVLDITDRKRLEKALEASRDEIRSLAASLMTAQDEERRRVSRELHDQISQQLAALAIDVGWMVASPPPPEDVQRRLKEIQARVVQAADETRHIAHQMHPSILDDLGLKASLEDLCRRFSDRYPDIALRFTSGGPPAAVPRDVASCAYRVAQESLRNIAKHAGAKHVTVRLSLRKGMLSLVIADDGEGFDAEAVKGRGGLGLIGMRERARLVNGKFTITAAPDQGTRITLHIPLPARAAGGETSHKP